MSGKENLYKKIKEYCLLKGYNITIFKEISYGIQFSINDNIIRIYESKKKGITLDLSQFKDEDLKEEILNFKDESCNKNTGGEVYPLMPPGLCGSDEVGKGDYLAPLIVCAIYLDKKEYDLLKNLGVKDSKNLTDEKIVVLAKKIKELTKNYSIMKIIPEKYNNLYEKINNINIILAMAHIKVIENVYDKQPFKNMLVDKFGQTKKIEESLKHLNLNIKFETNAEANIAVACASILARDSLLRHMAKIGQEYKTKIPLGAGGHVIDFARDFVDKHGRDELKKIAKLHFKSTNDVLKS